MLFIFVADCDHTLIEMVCVLYLYVCILLQIMCISYVARYLSETRYAYACEDNTVMYCKTNSVLRSYSGNIFLNFPEIHLYIMFYIWYILITPDIDIVARGYTGIQLIPT